MKRLLKTVFPHTIPVLIGYMVLGIAYGVLMNQAGFSVWFTGLTSLLFFAGSAQFVAIGFLSSGIHPLYAFVAFLMINARHLFYGISMLDKYKPIRPLIKKIYLIFALTDEAFSIVSKVDVPSDVNKDDFYLALSLMQQSYWVIASIIGASFGQLVSFNTTGLEFVLTALFLVIFIEYWKSSNNHMPAIIGLVVSVLALLIVGPEQFLVLSMALIVVVLLVMRSFDKKEELL